MKSETVTCTNRSESNGVVKGCWTFLLSLVYTWMVYKLNIHTYVCVGGEGDIAAEDTWAGLPGSPED